MKSIKASLVVLVCLFAFATSRFCVAGPILNDVWEFNEDESDSTGRPTIKDVLEFNRYSEDQDSSDGAANPIAVILKRMSQLQARVDAGEASLEQRMELEILATVVRKLLSLRSTGATFTELEYAPGAEQDPQTTQNVVQTTESVLKDAAPPDDSPASNPDDEGQLRSLFDPSSFFGEFDQRRNNRRLKELEEKSRTEGLTDEEKSEFASRLIIALIRQRQAEINGQIKLAKQVTILNQGDADSDQTQTTTDGNEGLGPSPQEAVRQANEILNQIALPDPNNGKQQQLDHEFALRIIFAKVDLAVAQIEIQESEKRIITKTPEDIQKANQALHEAVDGAQASDDQSDLLSIMGKSLAIGKKAAGDGVEGLALGLELFTANILQQAVRQIEEVEEAIERLRNNVGKIKEEELREPLADLLNRAEDALKSVREIYPNVEAMIEVIKGPGNPEQASEAASELSRANRIIEDVQQEVNRYFELRDTLTRSAREQRGQLFNKAGSDIDNLDTIEQAQLYTSLLIDFDTLDPIQQAIFFNLEAERRNDPELDGAIEAVQTYINTALTLLVHEPSNPPTNRPVTPPNTIADQNGGPLNQQQSGEGLQDVGQSIPAGEFPLPTSAGDVSDAFAQPINNASTNSAAINNINGGGNTGGGNNGGGNNGGGNPPQFPFQLTVVANPAGGAPSLTLNVTDLGNLFDGFDANGQPIIIPSARATGFAVGAPLPNVNGLNPIQILEVRCTVPKAQIPANLLPPAGTGNQASFNATNGTFQFNIDNSINPGGFDFQGTGTLDINVSGSNVTASPCITRGVFHVPTP